MVSTEFTVAKEPATDEIAFSLLSSVRAELNGQAVPLGDQKLRLILAVLLDRQGVPLPSSKLISLIWDDLPADPLQMLQNHMTKLRGKLNQAKSGAGSLLPRNDGGYQIQVARRQVDLNRFRGLAAQATSLVGQQNVKAAGLYRAALAQWGPLLDGPWTAEPLSDLKSCSWVDSTRTALLAEYETALLACLELELRIGTPRPLVPELQRLTGRADPPNDGFARLLMLALYRSGQKGDAIAAFRQHRKRTIDEVGNEPGAELKKLLQRICDDDPALNPPVSEPLTPGTPIEAATGEPETPAAEQEGTRADEGGRTDDQDHSRRVIEEIGETAAKLVARNARQALSGKLVLSPPAALELVETVQRNCEPGTEAFNALAAVEQTPTSINARGRLREALVVRMLGDASFRRSLKQLTDRLAAGPDTSKGTTFNVKRIHKIVNFNDKVHMRDLNC